MHKKSGFIKKTTAFLWVTILFIGLSSCQDGGVNRDILSPKYVFLFIGDGMGLAQIHAVEIMLGALKEQGIQVEKLNFSNFPGTGFMTTFSSNFYITDSAAAATAIASGHKTINGRINRDESNKKEFKTIAEMAKEKGMKVGIISNVPLNHATPACFYAGVNHRQKYYEIAQQMVESGFDFFGGGGIKYPSGRKGLQENILETARKKGYKVIQSESEFLSLGSQNRDERIIAVNETLTSEDALPYVIDRGVQEISLVQYVDKSIQLLDSDQGFFMVVEGGKIDWAAHDHDAATMIKEVMEFDEAVFRAYEFYCERPDETLIIVTADHETGGMTLGSEFSGSRLSLGLLNNQTLSLEKFYRDWLEPYKRDTVREEQSTEDLMRAIQEKFGLQILTEKEKEELYRSFKEPNDALFGLRVLEILSRKAGIAWTTGGHTASPVPVFSIGKNYQKFVGYYDNTDLFKKLVEVMGL